MDGRDAAQPAGLVVRECLDDFLAGVGYTAAVDLCVGDLFQVVPELTTPPDYDGALTALESVIKEPALKK